MSQTHPSLFCAVSSRHVEKPSFPKRSKSQPYSRSFSDLSPPGQYVDQKNWLTTTFRISSFSLFRHRHTNRNAEIENCTQIDISQYMIIFNYLTRETRVTALLESCVGHKQGGQYWLLFVCFVDLDSLALQNVFVFQPVISNLTIGLNSTRPLAELKSSLSSLKNSDGILCLCANRRPLMKTQKSMIILYNSVSHYMTNHATVKPIFLQVCLSPLNY